MTEGAQGRPDRSEKEAAVQKRKGMEPRPKAPERERARLL